MPGSTAAAGHAMAGSPLAGGVPTVAAHCLVAGMPEQATPFCAPDKLAPGALQPSPTLHSASMRASSHSTEFSSCACMETTALVTC